MKGLIAGALLLAIASFAAAQELGAKPQLVTGASVDPVAIRPGGTAPVQFLFRVNPGLHINSHTPTSKLLVPTSVEVQLPAGLKFARMEYPAGREFTVAFSDEKLDVYTGDVEVDGTLQAARALKPGSYNVGGVLHYQACNDRQCFPPRKLPLSFTVTVK